MTITASILFFSTILPRTS